MELAANGGALLLHLTLKATLLLLAVFAVQRVLMRASAALRHTFWLVGCFGLLLLPGFTIGLPAWQPSVLNPLGATLDTSTIAAPSHPAPLGSAQEMTSVLLRTIIAGHSDFAPLISTGQSILAAIFVLWLLGLIVVTRKLARGFVAAKRLQRRGRLINKGQLWHEFKQCAKSLDIPLSVLRATPRLMLVDDEASPIPLTWGCWHPVVVTPRASMQWPASCRRAALLHELSHIRRFDWLIQSLCSLTCLLYWFHPFAWLAFQRLRLESERATDDRVLATGLNATDYSSSLLEIIRFVGSHRGNDIHRKDSVMKFAVPISGTSKIEIRLRSILNTRQNRSAVTKKLLVVISLAALATVVPLAAAKEPTNDQGAPPLSTFTQRTLGGHDVPATAPKPFIVTGFKFKGNTVLNSDDLQKVLVSKTGVALNAQNISADVRAIQNAYLHKGFSVLVQSASQGDSGIIVFSTGNETHADQVTRAYHN